MHETCSYLRKETPQLRVPAFILHRYADRTETLHLPIQMDRSKPFWTHWSSKEPSLVVQEQTGPLPVSRPE